MSTNTIPKWAYDRGYDAGQADQSRTGKQLNYVVLDFGKLYKNSSGKWMLSAFGGADMRLPQARDMVVAWAHGFWAGTGADTRSIAYVGLGTNNSAGDITHAAGKALATSAQHAVNHAIQGGWYVQGRPMGANDFESFGKGSGHNASSRHWINGYNDATSKPILVNYGAADGCPTGSVPNPTSCNVGLNAESIWRVSWSGVAYPLPEVYRNDGAQAKQWRYLSRYSYNDHGGKFHFSGVMAQSGACSQSGCPASVDNTPTQAWNQLNHQLHQDSHVTYTPGSPTNIWHGPN